MHRNKLALLAGAALFLGAAQDAAAETPSWTGLYIGGNLGVSFGHVGTTVAVSPFTVPNFGTYPGSVSYLDLRPIGPIGGGQAGYNWEYSPGWLAGIEGD